MLSEKEIKYIQKNVISGSIDPEIMLSVLNSKRKASDQITVSDLSEAISEYVLNTANTSGEKFDSKAVEGEVVRLREIAKVEKEGAEIERIIRISAHVIEKFLPIAQSLLEKKMVDYTILSGKTQAVLMAEVVNKMQYGWVPLGGVSAAAFGMSPVGGNQYIQAMAKYV